MVASRCGDVLASCGWFDPTPALPADGEGGRTAFCLPSPRWRGVRGEVELKTRHNPFFIR